MGVNKNIYKYETLKYEIYDSALPLVQIICSYRFEEEIVTVIEDCTGWTLNTVLDACEDSYEDWVKNLEASMTLPEDDG